MEGHRRARGGGRGDRPSLVLVESVGRYSNPPSEVAPLPVFEDRCLPGHAGDGCELVMARHHRGITRTAFDGIWRRRRDPWFPVAMEKTAGERHPRLKNPAYRSATGKPCFAGLSHSRRGSAV